MQNGRHGGFRGFCLSLEKIMRALFLRFAALAVVFVLVSMALAQTNFRAENLKSGIAKAHQAVPGDRWMEIDLYWFEQTDIPGSVQGFWDRFYPIYAGIEGYRGLILNVGWTVGYIMEWSGDLNQQITLPSGKGQQPWVQETAPLPGTTADRLGEWKERFANPVMVPRHGYGSWTYGDLRKLADALRQEAARRGIQGFKVGSLTYAWDNAYGEVAPWAKRHSEAFTQWRFEKAGDIDQGRFFDPGAKLHRDPARLGGLPGGISEGASAHSVFAAQWGSLSNAAGLDAIMLRDSFGMPVPYQRAGPWGLVAPSPKLIADATDYVSALVRETKTANKAALIMMYSNAASAIGDWRSNGLDLERVAKEGYLDIFVDQTWAGAWNEVGVRHDNFWNYPTLGWTYQLTCNLMHAAMLYGTKVRHYPLIETFDAWESWDVLHTVPKRLRWGIWAYSHASVKTPHGIEVPAGSYISWANQGKRLLSQDDVQFLTTNINQAVTDARKTTQVFGPVLVYSRSAMRWQAEHAQPNSDVKEWLDEQAGSVIKWPIPILSATRIEWLSKIQADMFVLGAPSHLSTEELGAVIKIVKEGHPVAIFGSPAGGIDPNLQRVAGLSTTSNSAEPPKIQNASASPAAAALVSNLPAQFPVNQGVSRNVASGGAEVLYAIGDSPVLVLNRQSGKRLLAWDPPDFLDLCCKPLTEIWGGSAAPYALTTGAMNTLLDGRLTLHAARIDLDQAINVTAWGTGDGKLHILAANLEEGLREDADMNRVASLQVPADWKTIAWNSVWKATSVERSTFKISSGNASIGLMEIRLAPTASIQLEGYAAPPKSR